MKGQKVKLIALLVSFLYSFHSYGQSQAYAPQIVENKGSAAGFYLGMDIRDYEGPALVPEEPNCFRTSDRSVLISTDTEGRVREIAVFRFGVFTQRLVAIGQSTFYDVLSRYGTAVSITRLGGLVAVSYPDILFGFDASEVQSLQGRIKFILLRRGLDDPKEMDTFQFLLKQSPPSQNALSQNPPSQKAPSQDTSPQSKSVSLTPVSLSLAADVPKLLEPKVFGSKVCVCIGHVDLVTKRSSSLASRAFKPFHLYVYQTETSMAQCPNHARIRATRAKPGNRVWEIAKEGQTEPFEHAGINYYVKVVELDSQTREAKVEIGRIP